jgi:hypothetical protein
VDQACFDRLWNNTDGLQDSMEEMWRRVAAQLGSHPAVAAFEVMNEPASSNRWNDEMDGTVLPAFYERMGRAIHDASSRISRCFGMRDEAEHKKRPVIIRPTRRGGLWHEQAKYGA